MTKKSSFSEKKDPDYGLVPYLENNTLESKINSILENKDLSKKKKMKKLSSLKDDYKSDLSLSHIDYYIDVFHRQNIHRVQKLFCLFFLAALFFFGIKRSTQFYERFHNVDVSEQTLQAAIQYYQDGDYDAALFRFLLLQENGFTNYTIYKDMSNIYLSRKDYDRSVSILKNYIDTCYGIANITPENDALLSLLAIQEEKDLSAKTTSELEEIMDSYSRYTYSYAGLQDALIEGDYAAASSLCKNLSAVGADGFVYAAAYTTLLIQEEKYEDAFEYVISFVKDTSSYEKKAITISQCTALVTYIEPYLTGEQYISCETFLAEELDTRKMPDSKDTAEPYLLFEDVESIFYDLALSLTYLDSLDTITVTPKTELINGLECYPIIVDHIDSGEIKTNTFYLSMNQTLFLKCSGKYVRIPTDDYADKTESTAILGCCKKTYHNFASPEIELSFFYENFVCTCLVKNTKTNEVYLNHIPVSFSHGEEYGYLTLENKLQCTFIINETEPVILIKEDPTQEYSILEGRYLP